MNRRRRAAFLALALAPAAVVFAAPAAPSVIVPPAEAIDDAAARLALAEAYARLGRFAEAERIYETALAATAEPSAALLVAAGNMRLYAGRVAEALPYYRRAHAAAPADPAARRALALALAYTGAKDEARPLLEGLARENPGDQEVGRMLAEVSAGQGDGPERTLALLRERVEREPANVPARADLADLLAARGHALEAASLYDEARRLQSPKPGDAFDLRHARARLTWGDFYPAEAAFRAALAKSPADEELNASLIGLLLAMDRLERAEADAQLWRARAPGSAKAQAAVALARQKLHWDPPAPAAPPVPGTLAADFAAAGLEGTRREEFIRTYVGVPDRENLPPPAPAYRLSDLAGLYAAQGDFELAIRCYRAALRADPEYYPAWIGLAEFLAIAQHYEEAHREFALLAKAFPENRQVLLKQARALGWSRRYEDSIVAYEHLRAFNPADPVPLLEQARVAGWAKERDRSAKLYAQRWQDPVDARLAVSLGRSLASFKGWAEKNSPLLSKWCEWAEQPGLETDYLHEDEPFAATERFETDASELIAQVPDCLANDLRRIRLELRADFHLQRAFWLENRAKQLAWDRRWWRSEETYNRLLALSPGNQEALFDLSQVQAAQGLGQRERATLGRLLAIDGNNRLAASALFRRERRSEPLVFGQLDFYRERGRDQLSSIHRLRTTLGGETMLDDRFRFRGGLVQWREEPDTLPGASFHARGFTLGAEGVFTNWLVGSAEYTHKDDKGPGIGSTDTGGAQAWVPFKDALRVGAGVEVREELANQFAYFQGIRSTHHWFGAEAALSRRAEIAARADWIDYADDNAGTDFWIAPAYTWTDHPRTFKTTITFEARDTDEANVYQFGGPGGALSDITHPYWTPQDYRGVALTLEWRHDLAKDFFIGAPEHWYDVRVTFGLSNDSNQGVSWAADYVREWRDRWVLRLGAEQTFSEQWEDFRGLARLVLRF